MSHTSVRALVCHFGSNIGPATAGPTVPALMRLDGGGKVTGERDRETLRGRWEKEKQGKRKRGEREERRLKYTHVHVKWVRP